MVLSVTPVSEVPALVDPAPKVYDGHATAKNEKKGVCVLKKR